MERIVAILTQKGALSKGIQENTMVNLFRLKDNKVTSVESVKLQENTNNYFSLLMAIKRVSLIYVDTINNELRHLLNTIGIKTKCKDETDGDLFINQFIFD
ncbi:MAG: hypothetical protein E6772_12785 [Dysgonomonas sp.]|nr:hypothetical protein [Dysgonomonas sp.]